MKSLYLRSGLALLFALTLAACGGGHGNLTLSGSVGGLVKTGLSIKNVVNGEVLTIDAGASSFVFTKLLAEDEQFDVQIATQPVGAVCQTLNNKGKANVYTVYTVTVSCVTNAYNLGGTVTGLDGNGLVLANGADTVAIAKPAVAGAPVSFVFPTKVADGSPFGVTVLAQPQGTTKTCVASNNTGTMPSYDALGLIVTCK